MNYTILESGDDFVYGRINYPDIDDIHRRVYKAVDKLKAESGMIGDSDYELDVEQRKGKVAWIEKAPKLRQAIDFLAKDINDAYFNFDISDPNPDYQMTFYVDTNDHYDWHQDYYEEDEESFVRTLSMSLCLTPSNYYEGAEFFIKDGDEYNVRVFKMNYGEFIFFPSDVEHRVNALREGIRHSLVVWQGHER